MATKVKKTFASYEEWRAEFIKEEADQNTDLAEVLRKAIEVEKAKVKKASPSK